MLNTKERNLVIDLLECLNNTTDAKKCRHISHIIRQHHKDTFQKLIEEKRFKNEIKNILVVLANDEVFNIQSIRTKNIIAQLTENYKKTQDKYFFHIDDTLEENEKIIKNHEEKLYQENYQKYKDALFRDIDAPKKEKFYYGHNMSQLETDSISTELKMKRNAFEYEKIHDYQEFELNNNIAYEFAKRKYPMLYLLEHAHVNAILTHLFKYILPQRIDNILNTNKSPSIACICDYETEKINELVKIFREGKSFFNILDSLYRVNFSELTHDELVAREHAIYFSNLNNKGEKSIHSITPLFRLPKLEDYLDWEVNVKLNLSLPEEQLIEYIKHLKKSVVKKWNVLDNIFLSGMNLESYDITIITVFSKNIRKKNRIQIIVADILFTYDCLKLNFTKQEIAEELNIYYFDKQYSKGVKFPEDIVTAYTKIAISMIEEENYKKLVNGL